MKKIIVYSKTGNTLSVAESLNEKLNVELLRIIPESDDPNIQSPVLTQNPNIDDADELIIGTPVHGFLPAKVMQTFILSHNFNQKNVHLFVTHHFPFAWMGGKSAVKKMERMIIQQEGLVQSTHIINWSSKKRLANIEHLINDLSA